MKEPPNKIFADLEQGSDEWLALRRTKITASDASVIMGLNPWKTIFQLFDEKTGFTEVEENDAMRRGTELEPIAREAFIKETAVTVKPAVILSGEYEWMMASLDGISQNHLVACEIKCGKKSYSEAKKGRIAPYYLAQMQHQMCVAELDQIVYYAYSEENGTGIQILVKRDEEFIKTMIEKEKAFYDDLIMLKPPKRDLGLDFWTMSESEWTEKTLDAWKQASSLEWGCA